MVCRVGGLLYAGRQPDGLGDVGRDDRPEREFEQGRARLTSLQSSRSSVIISFTNCMSNCSEEVVDELAGGGFAEGESRAACPCTRTPATIAWSCRVSMIESAILANSRREWCPVGSPTVCASSPDGFVGIAHGERYKIL